MRWLSFLVFFVLAGAALCGCSTVDLRPIVDTTKKPRPIVLPPRKDCPREAGSLWCDNSDWNEIYSESPNRVPGDTILVRLTPRFRTQVLRRLKREYPIQVKTKVEGIEKGKPKVDVKVVPTGDQIADDDTQQIYMTVTEVLPRYIYRVKAQETIRVGSREPIVTFEGEIRNRDIQSDESVTTDSIMNSAFEIKPYGGDRQIAADGTTEENT